jgi:Glycosyl hydrolases family 25
MANVPYCIDIYAGDEVADAPGKPLAGFDRVKTAFNGIAFLDHKASEATGHKDARVGSRYQHWMDGKPIRVVDVTGDVLMIPPRFSFYHFNGPMTDIQAEVDNFLGAIKPYYKPGDDVCLDWEAIGASGYQVSAAKADTWCRMVEDKLGRSCKVYGGNVPREQLPRAASDVIDRFSKRRFWFCEYSSVLHSIPIAWQKTGIYQWQDDGDQYGPGPHRIPGMQGYCDNSTVVGGMTVDRLNQMWGQ